MGEGREGIDHPLFDLDGLVSRVQRFQAKNQVYTPWKLDVQHTSSLLFLECPRFPSNQSKLSKRLRPECSPALARHSCPFISLRPSDRMKPPQFLNTKPSYLPVTVTKPKNKRGSPLFSISLSARTLSLIEIDHHQRAARQSREGFLNIRTKCPDPLTLCIIVGGSEIRFGAVPSHVPLILGSKPCFNPSSPSCNKV